MQAYVSKRDALSDANDEKEQLQTAIKEMKGDMKALQERAAALEANRRGCACKKGDAGSSQAGRCINCSCFLAGAKCSAKCGCGIYCSRPDVDKQAQIDLHSEEQWNARMKKVLAARKAKAKEQQRAESDDDDEEYRPANKNKSKKKARAEESDDSDHEEGRVKAKGKGKQRDDDSDEDEPRPARGKGKKAREESSGEEEEARPAAAPRQNADRDPDDYDDEVDGLGDRINIDDNME